MTRGDHTSALIQSAPGLSKDAYLSAEDLHEIRNRIEVRYVEKNGCWEWTGSLGARGYGRLKYKGKFYLAHRLSHLVFNGPIIRGNLVCHHCDNPICINPSHIYSGTMADNVRDMVLRGRHGAMKPGVRSGEKNPNAKLSRSKAGVIRSKFSGGQSASSIAREYSVSQRTISDIVNGRSWNP